MNVDYEPIGDEVSVESSIIQAAQAIDLAAMIATEGRDGESLLSAAHSWTKLAEFIINVGEHTKEEKKTDLPVGFQRAPVTKDEEEIEEQIARDNED